MSFKQRKLQYLLTSEGEVFAESEELIPWKNAYPRPRMRRERWINLNGLWALSAAPTRDEQGKILPEETECQSDIRVPFAPESLLSGIGRSVGDHVALVYRQVFTLPEGFLHEGEKLLLHFGAVDQYAEVYVNGNLAPTVTGEMRHMGGYLPFTCDITEFLKNETNTICVAVEDDLDRHILPYGKQSNHPGGMWYTPVSGIWQTVWLESVPETYIKDLQISNQGNTVTVMADGVSEGMVAVTLPTGCQEYPLVNGVARFTVEEPLYWTPENPYLYECTVTAGKDTVSSYFAIRTLEIKTVNGIPRLCLNGKPYFFHALLDQGYWSDGLWTPADEHGFERDILAMKSLGFNTLRKHIKIEPQQFYYDCDRLGMIVMQDMVNNGTYSFIRDTALPTVGMKKLNDRKLHKNRVTRQIFEDHMEETIKYLSSHPCICYWTIFNEGWGQFESQLMYQKLKALDSGRFIDTVSGWFKGAESDVDSEHIYFKPVKLKYSDKPMVLSEFGGYAWKIDGHAANPDHIYGYRIYKDGQSFEDAVVTLYEKEIIPAVKEGLCGAVYTQVSDVEDETNGFLTYDRRVLKVTPERMQRIAKALASAVSSESDMADP